MESQISQAPPPGEPDVTETTSATGAAAADETNETEEATVAPEVMGAEPVGGPVSRAWRVATLTRAKELEALCAWVLANNPRSNYHVLAEAIPCHIAAAREAARATRSLNKFRVFRNALLFERAMTNLDAAEVHLLNIASADYLLGQLPSLLRDVQCHLLPGDPRRQEVERIAKALGVKDPDHPLAGNGQPPVDPTTKIEQEHGKIVTAVRGARSVALREQVRLRSFRNVLIVTTVLMSLLALGVGFIGVRSPTLIPLCFAPEEAGRAVVVCPTQQSPSFSTARDAGAQAQTTTTTTGTQGTTQAQQTQQTQRGQQETATTTATDIDNYVADTVSKWDLFLVEFVGMAAAAVAAAAAIRRLKGSSERHGLPIALAVLKLPTGAITAFLGLLLMRGQFVPGLSALDTSAQILAWALVFGYAQQLFTRLVDQQGQTVLESVRGADRPQATPAPP
jgi:hypothetical protein